MEMLEVVQWFCIVCAFVCLGIQLWINRQMGKRLNYHHDALQQLFLNSTLQSQSILKMEGIMLEKEEKTNSLVQ